MHKIFRGHISPPLLEAAISKYGKAPKAEEVAPNVDKVVPANEDDFKLSLRSQVRGILTLPCWRTLQDYTHFIKAGVGVQPEVTNQIVKEANVKQEYQVYVAIVFDEMKIKEGLVYDKYECRIIGFIDLGPVNNAFASFERTLDESGGHTAPIAKQILVFMVRGIFMKPKFPYAQFPTSGVSGRSLFFLAWEVVRNLEVAGFKVVSLTGDGASPNRRFFQLHYIAPVVCPGRIVSTKSLTHTVKKRGTSTSFLMCHT